MRGAWPCAELCVGDVIDVRLRGGREVMESLEVVALVGTFALLRGRDGETFNLFTSSGTCMWRPCVWADTVPAMRV